MAPIAEASVVMYFYTLGQQHEVHSEGSVTENERWHSQSCKQNRKGKEKSWSREYRVL